MKINNITKYAINFIGWGLVTDIANKAEKYRWLGTNRYTILSVLEVFTYKPRLAKLIIDNEKQVSGPNVMNRYSNKPEQSNDVLVHRDNKIWYKTGDSGYLENEFLYYTGRINDNYKLSNGKFVNVDETEAIIKKYINGMVIVCGENQDRNDIITDQHITSQIKEQINEDENKGYFIPANKLFIFI